MKHAEKTPKRDQGAMVSYHTLAPVRGRAIKPSLQSAATYRVPTWPFQHSPRANQPADERQNQADH